MDQLREGGSISRSPLLDGSNYPYWKARMRAFLKSIDERVWTSIVYGWSPPVETDDKGKEILKPENKWSTAEYDSANWNSKGINAIMAFVNVHQFKVISNYTKELNQ